MRKLLGAFVLGIVLTLFTTSCATDTADSADTAKGTTSDTSATEPDAGEPGSPDAEDPGEADNSVNPDPSDATQECTLADGLAAFLECSRGDPVAPAPANAAPPDSDVDDPANPYPYTVEEYLNYIATDVDAMWSRWFASQGLAEPTVWLRIIGNGQTITSGCDLNDDGISNDTIGPDYPNAFYCPVDTTVGDDGYTYDGAVILPVLTMQKMWNGDIFGNASTQLGDFAAGILVAHEMGHHIQDEIWTQLRNAGADLPWYRARELNFELIADCFSGVWMASAYHTAVLTDTDYYEAVAALQAIGADPNPNRTHGTREERIEALLLGYHGDGTTAPGDPNACLTAYPPGG
jgi:predicted metalloprotease